jgi:FAD/FMN-containing dehydrogenase
MKVEPKKQAPWKPQYGYRRIRGWRQKILFGTAWAYPQRNEPIPSAIGFFVSARRRTKTLFFIRSFGFCISRFWGRDVTYIDVEIPATLTADRLRRFVDHCHRSGIAESKLGLPGVRLKRFSVDRGRAKHL